MKLNELLSSSKPPKNNLSLEPQELTRLFWKYKGLLKERERNVSFWESTNENLKMAYEKLDEQESKLNKAYNLNRKYLDNIKEGLLLIDENFTIQNQYSLFLQDLFKISNLEGKNFIDLIYPEGNDYEFEKKELAKFISILFNNQVTDIEMIMDVNPLLNKKLIINNNGTNTEIIINANFTRIFDKGTVKNIMVIFEDKTHLIKMQNKIENEKSKYEEEIKSISAILKAGPVAFIDFLEESRVILAVLSKNLNRLFDIKVINHLFRDVHSLKGSAKYLELNYIAAVAHRLEDIFQLLKDSKSSINDKILFDIKSIVTQLNTQFNNLEAIINKFKTFSQLTHKMNTSITNKKDNTQLNSFLSSLNNMTKNISRELHKDIKFTSINSIDHLPCLNLIKSPVIHLIRNSIDHGIENKNERLKKHKDSIGKIQLKLFKDTKNYYIEITDDGSGLNFEKIKQKAIEKKIFNQADHIEDKQKLLKLIFSPNFSMKDQVTDLSGRGYGLDIVKDTIETIHGKIKVNTQKDKGTKFTLEIPI